MLHHAGFSVICLDRPLPGNSVPTVLGDNYDGAKQATTYLIHIGRNRILCIGGDNALLTSQRRARGHRDAVMQAGLPYFAELNAQDLPATHAAAESAPARSTANRCGLFHEERTHRARLQVFACRWLPHPAGRSRSSDTTISNSPMRWIRQSQWVAIPL